MQLTKKLLVAPNAIHKEAPSGSECDW